MTIRAPAFRQIAFIDPEASGLGSASFPTEIGWAIISENGSVESGSCLIRPVANCTMYTNAWSPASEALTGITGEMLHREGLPPRDVLKRFLDAVEERDLFSDEPGFDAHWLATLVDAASTSIKGQTVCDAKKLVAQMGAKQGLEFDKPPRHRAEADARRLALAVAQAIPPVRS